MMNESIFNFVCSNDFEYFVRQISFKKNFDSKLINKKTGILKQRTSLRKLKGCKSD